MHGLDALRALAMFLGVVLHSALSFLTIDTTFSPRWDDSRSGLLDVAVFGIHAFRMQAFFVVAGYLAALGLARRPLSEFLSGRALRIGLPLVVGAVTIVPLTIAPFLIARDVPIWSPALVAAPGHLWFLIYLSIFSLGAAAWSVCTERAAGTDGQRRLGDGGLLARAACAPWLIGVPLLMVPTVALNMTMPTWIIETPWGWIPSAASVAYYGLFFATGYALHRSGRMDSVGRGWPVLLPLAVSVLLPALIVVGPGLTPELVKNASGRPLLSHLAHAPAAIVQAALTWCMVLGLLGFMLRVCRHPSPWLRWLADASYWVYLTHLPVVYFLQLWLVPINVPGLPVGQFAAVLKFALILSITLAFCLLTYAAVVRRTALERVIGGGGKKYSEPTPKTPQAGLS